jgi:release factor glutamine methyltransferase
MEKLDSVNVLDMCTGSGCIAVSLAKYVEGLNVSAVDISNDALEVARENAKNNNVLINFAQSNLFEELDENNKFDVIVSNPPYIKTEEIKKLQKEVTENEPIIALDGGEDGLEFYRSISRDAKRFLKNDGHLIFEIGFDEKDDVVKILKEEGYSNTNVINDFSGNNRVVSGVYIMEG